MSSTKLRESGYRAEMDDAERASRDEIMALANQANGVVAGACL
jgi:hypothetical protein